jgi:hypothetical protein
LEGENMLNSKQKVLKKIYDRYLSEYGKALSIFDNKKSFKACSQAEENKRLALLALNQIF